MRIFIAIDLPSSIRSDIERKQKLFRAALSHNPKDAAGIRWTQPEGIHLTLKFLGEVPEGGLEHVIERLSRLELFEAFPVEVKNFGFFPDARHPRVFWAGVTGPPQLPALATLIETAVSDLGFCKELRPFKPHLTLARFRLTRPQSVLEVMSKREEDTSLGQFVVSEFFVFESKLSATAAPEYRKLARFPLR